MLRNSKGNPLSGGVKYTECEKIATLTEIAVYLGIRDRPMAAMER